MRVLVLQLCGRPFHDVDGAPVKEQRQRLLEHWLNTDVDATWNKLVNALKTPAVGQYALAERIRMEYS